MVSTFINNLRLEEMTPGEKDNTWGDITNRNLELIAQSLGIGRLTMLTTDAVFEMPDADKTANGAELRSLYLVIDANPPLTTPGSVTIDPNIISKAWIIKNDTAQTLTIRQGTGTSVDIPSAETKIVVTDGGGPPANVIGIDVGGGAGLQNIVDIDGGVDINGKDIITEVRYSTNGTPYANLTSNVSGALSIVANAGNDTTLTSAALRLRVGTSGTSNLIIDSAGDVAIGGAEALDLGATKNLSIVGNASGGGAAVVLVSSTETVEDTKNKYISSIEGSFVIGRLDDDATAPINQLIINNDGNVYIGLGGNLTVQATTGSTPTGGIINGRGVNAGSYTVGSPGATEIGSIYVQDSATIKDTFTLSATNGLRVYGSNGGLQPPTYINATDRDAIDPVRSGEIVNISGVLWVNTTGTTGAGNWERIVTTASRSGVQAWVNLDGTPNVGNRIISQFNVASVTDDEPTTNGLYTINFTNPISEDAICIATTMNDTNTIFPWVNVNMISPTQAQISVVAIFPIAPLGGPGPANCAQVYVSFIGNS